MPYRGPPKLQDQVAQKIAQKVAEGMDDDEKLYEAVNQLLTLLETLRENQIKKILGGTTATAYRRVHERLASSIDKILEKLRSIKHEKDESSKGIDIKNIAGSALADLTRSQILLRYQNARGQISDDLRSILESIVSKLVNDIKSLQSSDSQKLEELRRKLERARSLIDAIAVLAYEYKKYKKYE